MKAPILTLPGILVGMTVAGLTGGILIPTITRPDRIQQANGLCRAQFNAAKAAGARLPDIDVTTLRHQTVDGGRRAQCGTSDGTFTWDPTNNALALYGPR